MSGLHHAERRGSVVLVRQAGPASAPLAAPSWADHVQRQSSDGVLLPHSSHTSLQSTHVHQALIHQLRRERAELLDRSAEPEALLVRPEELVPASRIPEEWHIRLALPQRPTHLDEYGSRFLWTADADSSSSPRRGGGSGGGFGGAGGGGDANGGGRGSGTLTVFPMLEPHGALDVELLEHWVREMMATDAAGRDGGGDGGSGGGDRGSGGSGGGGARRRQLDVVAMAVHEVGRASGAARCALLERLWERASALWRDEAEARTLESKERLASVERQLEQRTHQLRECELRLADASQRSRADRLALADARRGGEAAMVRGKADEVAARQAVLTNQRATARAEEKLLAAAAHLTSLAEVIPSSAAAEVLMDVVAALQAPEGVEAPEGGGLKGMAARGRVLSAAAAFTPQEGGGGKPEDAKGGGGTRSPSQSRSSPSKQQQQQQQQYKAGGGSGHASPPKTQQRVGGGGGGQVRREAARREAATSPSITSALAPAASSSGAAANAAGPASSAAGAADTSGQLITPPRTPVPQGAYSPSSRPSSPALAPDDTPSASEMAATEARAAGGGGDDEEDASVIGGMHYDFEKATDSLHSLVQSAKDGASAIQMNNDVFAGTLKRMVDNAKGTSAVLTQSNQLIAAMRLAGPPRIQSDAATQTAVSGQEMAEAVIEVLNNHRDAVRKGERWSGGFEGRAASASRVRELLVATGLGGGQSRVETAEAEAQATPPETEGRGLHAGGGTWADPVPHSWAPWVCPIAPLPAGILTIKRLRSLIWAVYIDRMDAEPTLTRLGVESAPEQAARLPPLTSAGEGGATDVVAPGEVVVKTRLQPRTNFADFVTDWLDHHYKHRALAAAQLNAMLGALRRHTSTADDVRLSTFERLCGCTRQPKIGNEGLLVMLRTMHLSLSLSPGSCAAFGSDSTYLLSIERTLAVVHSLFGKEGLNLPKVEEQVRDKLVEIGAGKGAGGRSSMDIDEFAMMMLVEHEAAVRASASDRVRASLLELFASADANSDGKISLEEWQIVLAAQGRHASEALPLFRRMLEASAAVGVDPMLAVASSSGAGNAALKHGSGGIEAKAAAPAAAPPATGGGLGSASGPGVSLAAFLEVCEGLGFTSPPPDTEHDCAAELLACNKEWLSRQAVVASKLSALRAHVLAVGWKHTAEYPSAGLLTRARELLGECSAAMGRLVRASPGASQTAVEAALEELLRTLERGHVAIEIEIAGATPEGAELLEGGDMEISAASSFSTI